MEKAKKSPSSLFRTPVRTLTSEQIAHVTGGVYQAREVGKPSSTLIDIEGFR